MLHDLIIVGAGPVGATLALALAESDLDVIALDARAVGAIGRGDRSLALSHGARLILERVGVWSAVGAGGDAVTPITAIDISQRGGFGHMRLEALEQELPALGYVVSYRALQAALDAALARAGIDVRHSAAVGEIRATPAYAVVATLRGDPRSEVTARLVALADGSGDIAAGITRRRHDYGQVALIGKIWPREAHRGVAFERFTPQGPIALLPEDDHYGLVWTTTPQQSESLLALPDAEFLAALGRRFGKRGGARDMMAHAQPAFERVADRRVFPLQLNYARSVVGERIALLGNAAQALHPVAGQGFNLGMRDAYELAQELLAAPREAIGSRARLAAYARRRRGDRVAGIAFTHALLGIFGSDAPLLRWPRGLALTMLDASPAVKRAFARAMSFGMRS